MQQGRKTEKNEIIVSIVVLCCIVLVAIGVFFKQFFYDPSRFGPETASNSSGQGNSAGTTAGFAVPAPPGFKAVAKPQSFDTDSLYVKIDGKADLYLASGFKQLICQQFVSEKDDSVWIEFYAYDMGKGRNAFSVYSVQKRPEGQDVNVTELSYKTPDALFMCVGKYYCETVGSNASPELLDAMMQAGKNFVTAKGKDAGKIEELELFPKDNMVAGSFKLYLTDAYGYAGFINTFSASYKIGTSEVTVFVFPAGDAHKAQATAEAYKKFIQDNGGTAAAAANKELDGAVLDLGGMYEVVFAEGNYVGGVHEGDRKETAESVAAALRQQLKANK